MTIALIFILIVMAMLTPAFFCAGFYFGFNTAEGVFTQQTATVENIPGAKVLEHTKQAVSDKLQKETDEERMARILAENVENFGTNVPQKEVV